MKENIVILHKNTRDIDKDYFSNYGGGMYSQTYKNYTIDPATLIHSLMNKDIYFKTLLDAGCASGELVRDFRILGIQAYGIEKNKDILAKSVVPQYCAEMDLRDISEIKEESFDMIYFNSGMYFYPQELLPILKEFHRICKKGVYLCTPFLEDNLTDTFNDPSRVFLAKVIWWDKQFQEANFEKIDTNIYIKN